MRTITRSHTSTPTRESYPTPSRTSSVSSTRSSSSSYSASSVSSASSASSAHVDLHVPYDSYKGAFINEKFRLQQLRLRSDYLDIYTVSCLCGCRAEFEAQAFSLNLSSAPPSTSSYGHPTDCANDSSDPDRDNHNSNSNNNDAAAVGRKKLLDSRRRRMKRIYRSSNFIDVFECCGKRFLVSRVERSEKEWRDVCDQITRNSTSSGIASSPSSAAAGAGAVSSSAPGRGGGPDAARSAGKARFQMRNLDECRFGSRQADPSYLQRLADDEDDVMDWEPSSYADALMKGLHNAKN